MENSSGPQDTPYVGSREMVPWMYEMVQWIQDPKKLVDYGIGLFLLTGKLARIPFREFREFREFLNFLNILRIDFRSIYERSQTRCF